jgi:hypothetical protein
MMAIFEKWVTVIGEVHLRGSARKAYEKITTQELGSI